jgi:hypothetical protein
MSDLDVGISESVADQEFGWLLEQAHARPASDFTGEFWRRLDKLTPLERHMVASQVEWTFAALISRVIRLGDKATVPLEQMEPAALMAVAAGFTRGVVSALPRDCETAGMLTELTELMAEHATDLLAEAGA